MSWYLVKMTPIEPYSFGTDQNFVYDDNEEKRTGKETYFVNSNLVPEQTTVYGLIRYLILKDKGLLRPDFRYSHEDIQQIHKCIGDSFSFTQENYSSGEIEEMSPVFLISDEGHYLIKNPFCNTAKDGFEPMHMEKKIITTSEGDIHLPAGFKAKDGYASGWFDVDARKPVVEDKKNPVFKSIMLTGNKKNGENADRDDSFFKRQVVILKKGYSFAVFVNTKSLPKKEIGYMGKKHSAFLITTQKKEKNDLALRAQEALKRTGSDPWFYALSDICTATVEYRDFCIVEEKSIRTLETVYRANNRGRMRKSNTRIHLIKAGSVFYGSDNKPEIISSNASKIGYNQIIRIGGGK